MTKLEAKSNFVVKIYTDGIKDRTIATEEST